MIGIALVGIYLMIESNRASFPTKLFPALFVIFGVVLQYAIALWINDSIWNSFFMIVSLEILAFFLALTPNAITLGKAEGQIPLRILTFCLFLAAPLWLNWHWINNLFENIWQGIGVGILLASISIARMLPTKRTTNAQAMNPDATILFIALGTMAWTLSYFAFQFR
jgi:putative effector of murein hydrolase